MKINSSAPASAPTPEQPAEVENESVAENGGADFSALLFLMLATPQAQPLTLANGEVQTGMSEGAACVDGACTVPMFLAQSSEALLQANGLTEIGAQGEELTVTLPLASFESTAESLWANVATGEAMPTVAQAASQETMSELAPTQSADEAPTETPVLPVHAEQLNQNAGVNSSKQLADEAAEKARLAAQEEEDSVNPLLQRDRLATQANGNQAVGNVAAADGLDGSGVKDARDKDGLDKAKGRDHSLQSDLASASFAAALHNGSSAQRPEGAAAPFAAPVVDRVANEIAAQVRTNQNEAIITLDPPELGSLRIALILDGDKVQARIIAEMTDSGNLIHNHLPELKEALSGHRLDLVDVHIDSGNWNSANSDLTQNFQREFAEQRQWRGGREAPDRPLTDSAQATPVMPRSQPTSARTTRVSMWA